MTVITKGIFLQIGLDFYIEQIPLVHICNINTSRALLIFSLLLCHKTTVILKSSNGSESQEPFFYHGR